MKNAVASILFVLGSVSAACGQQLNVYPVPQGILYSMHNDDFTVRVRIPDGEWEDLYEYKVGVDMDTKSTASMVQFDFEGTVEMMVQVNNGLVHDVQIRPLHKNIVHARQENLIFLTLDRPAKLSLEVNGDRLHNLHVFANEMEREIPDRNDPNVVWFDTGVHIPPDNPGDTFRIGSGKTVYLAPGAIVKGKFVCDNVENVRFLGRGFILQPQRGFEIIHSRNISIDGITVINPKHYTVYGGQTVGLNIRNLKSFSDQGWSDGIDLMSCSEVTIRDIFLRNSDDCIAIYGHRWDFYGDARNYEVVDAILWADIAHPINIGLHGDTSHEGNAIENLRFRNIDILEHDEDDRNYQGCMAFSVSDHNLVREVLFEDIRVERIQEGQLFNLRVLFNEKYSHGPGRGIENVTFRNVSYTGSAENPSIILGYDSAHPVRGIRFEQIVINGMEVKTFEEAGIRIGEYTEDITIR